MVLKNVAISARSLRVELEERFLEILSSLSRDSFEFLPEDGASIFQSLSKIFVDRLEVYRTRDLYWIFFWEGGGGGNVSSTL